MGGNMRTCRLRVRGNNIRSALPGQAENRVQSEQGSGHQDQTVRPCDLGTGKGHEAQTDGAQTETYGPEPSGPAAGRAQTEGEQADGTEGQTLWPEGKDHGVERIGGEMEDKFQTVEKTDGGARPRQSTAAG